MYQPDSVFFATITFPGDASVGLTALTFTAQIPDFREVFGESGNRLVADLRTVTRNRLAEFYQSMHDEARPVVVFSDESDYEGEPPVEADGLTRGSGQPVPTRRLPFITLENYPRHRPDMNVAPLYSSDRSRHFAFCENDRLLTQAIRGRIELLKVGEVRTEVTRFIAEVNQLIDDGLIVCLPG